MTELPSPQNDDQATGTAQLINVLPAFLHSEVKKIDHIAIAVKDIEQALRVYGSLGLIVSHTEVVQDQGVRTTFIDIGGTHLELLEPLHDDTPVGKFIAKRGQGIHHICLEVTDLPGMLEKLRAEGFDLIDPEPRLGAQGKLIAFVHPKATGGVLLELSAGLPTENLIDKPEEK